VAHFLLISLWESWNAIRSFAGEDIERARYYPQDAEYLLELEPKVTHYEVVDTGTTGIRPGEAHYGVGSGCKTIMGIWRWVRRS
jgi:hypothetical protein